MPIDSTNYGRENKNLRAEISDLRTEVAFMYSAFQNIQEQFGFALAEIANSIKTLNGEIKNFQQNNSVADSVNENFSRIEKISETQQLNFRNYFDKIENSLAAQQKIFSDIFNQQSADFEKNFNSMQEKVSGVGENISVVQKNIKKFSSEVDEILSDNQKNLLKKIDSANDKPKDFYKTLNAIEELLRLIAANQLLNQVQQNLPTKNNSLPKVSASRKKKIFIYGRSKVGKSTLEELLLKRFHNLEITETKAIERYEVETSPNADLVIYLTTNSSIDSNEIKRFNKIYRANKKILLVMNAKLLYDMDTRLYSARSQVKIQMTDTVRLNDVYKNFLSNVGLYDWSKISAVNVNLQAALRGLRSDKELFELSNFEAIEKFINEL